jgi:hypothetical protein
MEFIGRVIEIAAQFAPWTFGILSAAVLAASLIQHPWAKAFVSIVANTGPDSDLDSAARPSASKQAQPRYYAAS